MDSFALHAAIPRNACTVTITNSSEERFSHASQDVREDAVHAREHNEKHHRMLSAHKIDKTESSPAEECHHILFVRP